jgi:hypothetical protein
MTIQEYLDWARKYPDQLPTVHQYLDLLYEDHMTNHCIVGLWTNKMWAEWLTEKIIKKK